MKSKRGLTFCYPDAEKALPFHLIFSYLVQLQCLSVWIFEQKEIFFEPWRPHISYYLWFLFRFANSAYSTVQAFSIRPWRRIKIVICCINTWCIGYTTFHSRSVGIYTCNIFFFKYQIQFKDIFSFPFFHIFIWDGFSDSGKQLFSSSALLISDTGPGCWEGCRFYPRRLG